MADNVTLNSGSGGATMRTLEDGSSIQWPACVVAYATTVGTPDVLQVVTDSAGMPVAQQGTWTVTANAGSGTFAVSAASLPLPSGAATAAKQPALGTAGTASADVITVQGIASMTALKVDGSAVTQPVSLAAAVAVTDNSGSLTVDAPVGTPVFVRLSDGSAAITTLAVSAASLPLPSGASTAAKQPALGTAGSASSDVITIQGVASMTPVAVSDNSGSLTVDNAGTFAVQAAQSGSWTVTSNAGTGFPAVYTEDAASGGGETGVLAMGVRKDADTSPVSNDGDYHTLVFDATGNLKVNVVAGGAGDGAILDGVSSSIKASVLDYTNSNPLAVRLSDTNGDYVAAGAGTQYTEDDAAASNPVGSMLMAVRRDSLSASEVSTDGDNIALKASSYGQLHVALANSVTVSGTVTANAGTDLNTSALALESGGNLATIAGAVRAEDAASANGHTGIVALAVRTDTPGNSSGADGDYEMLQVAGGRLWVDASGKTLTVDGSGVTQPVSAASLPLPTGASTAAKQPALGTAGSASSDVITIQGIASMTAVKVDGSAVTQPVSGTVAVNTVTTVSTVNTVTAVTAISNALPAGTNLLGRASASLETSTIYDAATALTPKFAAITANATGNTSIVAAVASKKIRVLRWRVVSNGAVNIQWLDGTNTITGLSYMTQYAAAGGGFCPVGHFETTANTALQLSLSANTAVGGELTYIEV